MIALAAEPIVEATRTGETPSVFARAFGSHAYPVTCKDGLRIGVHMSSPQKFWEGLVEASDAPMRCPQD